MQIQMTVCPIEISIGAVMRAALGSVQTSHAATPIVDADFTATATAFNALATFGDI